MSELSSLFVKLTIKKENLDRFLTARPASPVIDADWTSWWESLDMYDKSPLEEIPMVKTATNGEVFASYINSPQTLSQEKQEDGVYYFVSGFFSENFYEILPMLALLKSVADYMEPGDKGEVYIYDFFWSGGDVMAHMELTPGKAILKHTKERGKIDKAIMAESDRMLQEMIEGLPAD